MDVIHIDDAHRDISPDNPGMYGIAIKTHPLTLVAINRADGCRSESSYGSQEFCNQINLTVDSLGVRADEILSNLLQGVTAYTPDAIRFIKELHPPKNTEAR